MGTSGNGAAVRDLEEMFLLASKQYLWTKPDLTVFQLGFVLTNPITDKTYISDMSYHVSRLAA